MKISPAIPVLRSFNEAHARAFYVDFLGCTVDWEHRFDADAPLYMQVHRGDLVLHLSEHFGDGTPGAAVFIQIDDIAALHAELNAKNFRHARPGLVEQDWGMTMHIADPFGNHLRFCQRQDATPP
jgi:extradiol dioxygenase family protein